MDFGGLGKGKNGIFYKLLIIRYLHFVEMFGMEPYILPIMTSSDLTLTTEQRYTSLCYPSFY